VGLKGSDSKYDWAKTIPPTCFEDHVTEVI